MTERNNSLAKSIIVYYCGREDCEPGHDFGPAVRMQCLLHFVTSGKGVYQVGKQRFLLHAGQAFFIRPNEVTYYKADDADPWSYVWVAFDGLDADELIGRAGLKNSYTITVSEPERFKAHLLSVILHFQKGDEYRVLEHFYGAMAVICTGGTSYEPIQAETYFNRAVSYIHNNYIYSIKIGDVANHTGIDRTYLYKIFMTGCGVSPKQYLQSVRIGAAREMLLKRRYSITEVAFSCGFSDVPGFCKSFKNVVGVTPKEFAQSDGRILYLDGSGGAARHRLF